MEKQVKTISFFKRKSTLKKYLQVRKEFIINLKIITPPFHAITYYLEHHKTGKKFVEKYFKTLLQQKL